MEEKTTIRLTKKTVKRLQERGKKGEEYEDIVASLLDQIEERK